MNKNDNKTPQSVFDIEAVAAAYAQPDHVEIPLPANGVLVMRTNVDYEEWRDVPMQAGAWLGAIKETPIWKSEGCDGMTTGDLINVYIVKTYSIPQMSDVTAIRFIKAIKLGIAGVLERWESGIKLMSNVQMKALLDQKKGS